MLSLHLILVGLYSSSQKPLVAAILRRCGWVLVSSSGQTTYSLLFSRKISTGFTWASFLMSSFLMWSNLVFPFAHLNILISAGFSLLSSFFFTAHHSEPYVIAGLMIVLKILSFNSTGIFLSHITPDQAIMYSISTHCGSGLPRLIQPSTFRHKV